MKKPNQIIIAMSAKGILNLDQMKVGEIIIDNQAHRLLLRRANEDGTSIAEALKKTLTEAIGEYVSQKTFN